MKAVNRVCYEERTKLGFIFGSCASKPRIQ